MKIIDSETLCSMIRQVGLPEFFRRVSDALESDLGRWEQFSITPRHATHYPHGVIELMPCADEEYYSYKYVNGHPANTQVGKLTVVACGMLVEVATGYPLLLSEMTLLTAIRTAVTASIAAKYLCRSGASEIAMIGTGAQAEFQVFALLDRFPIERIRYYDPDPRAMQKFRLNMEQADGPALVAAEDVRDAVTSVDLIITATAAKTHARILNSSFIRPGTHIQAIGGDCPGKTEIDPELLEKSRIVVEYLDQSRLEGEIQSLPKLPVHAELWEVVSGRKSGRESDLEITIFDAVGCALEDFSILRVVYDLADELGTGTETDLFPAPADPKNLFGVLGGP